MVKINKKIANCAEKIGGGTNRFLTKRLLSLALSAVMMLVLSGVMPKVEAVNFNKSYSLGSNPGQNMVNIALAQQGKTGSQLGYTADWCAYFVSDCAELAGQSKAIPRHGRADCLDTNILNAGGRKVNFSEAKPGDIAFYDGNYNNSPDHVEIVYSVSGSKVTTLGGNTGSTGSYKTNKVSAPRSYGNILYIIRPNYSGSANPPVQNNDTELGINYPRPSGSPYLQSGSKGSGVSWLQTALNKANNAGLAVDGQFGSGTKQAVINFQRAYGLSADGIAGPSTINKLVEVIKNKINPPVPSIKIKYKSWISDSKMGNEVSSFEIGKWYYFCYKIYDEYSDKLISETSANLNEYKITETIYNPDGSVFNTCTYDNSDNNWIGIKPSYTGTYKWELKLTITKTGGTSTTSGEFNVTHTHSYGSWTTTKSATCESDGSEKRTCSVCGNSETRTISKIGHKYTEKIVAPTSTQKGYTLHTCSKCGYSYKDNYTEFEFTASTSSVSLNGFENKNVTFSYKNYNDGVTISWKHADTHATTLSWGEWSNNTIALNIAGYAKGTEKITVYLKDTNTGNILATKTITVTVTGIETKLNASSTSLSISMDKNEKKSVTFSYDNVPASTDHMNIRWIHGDNKATSLVWSGWENNTVTLYITGYFPGTENIKIEFYDSDTEEVLATKTIIVTVTCQHKYTTKVVDPTYTELGYTLHSCSVCGDSFKDNFTNKKEKGDINIDNSTNISDILILNQYLNKSKSLTKDQFLAADINNDGKINVFDLILLKRMIIKNKLK